MALLDIVEVDLRVERVACAAGRTAARTAAWSIVLWMMAVEIHLSEISRIVDDWWLALNVHNSLGYGTLFILFQDMTMANAAIVRSITLSLA
jgi:hypothetical protein